MVERMAVYREALRLHREYGLGSVLIGRKLGVSENTVSNWLYRGVVPNRKFVPWNKGLTKEADERIRRLAKNNEGSIPWNKGVPWSDEVKNKMRLAKLGKPQPLQVQKMAEANRGKKRSDETKRKLSLANSGQVPWNKGRTGVYSDEHLAFLSGLHKGNKYNVGRVVSEETRNKIAESLVGHRVSKETRGRIRSKRLLQVFPVKDTVIEVAMQDELDRRGVIYEKHVPVCGVCQPDIVFPDLKLAVFCDGDYWHNLSHIVVKDRRHDSVLRENDWVPLRFWESEIKADVVGCVDQVLRFLGGVTR